MSYGNKIYKQTNKTIVLGKRFALLCVPGERNCDTLRTNIKESVCYNTKIHIIVTFQDMCIRHHLETSEQTSEGEGRIRHSSVAATASKANRPPFISKLKK